MKYVHIFEKNFKDTTMRVANKDLIQSYIFTMAVFHFNVYERRVLYRIAQNCQYMLEGQKLNNGFRIDNGVYEDKLFTCPINLFFKTGETTNHARVKEALKGLNDKMMMYEDDDEWKIIRVIEKPKFQKKIGTVTFEIQPEVYRALLNFSKGWRKYDIAIVMNLESVYAMRFYEMFSYQTTTVIYTIDALKTMFGITDKYINNSTNFINRVVKFAQKELDEKSPYSFTFKPIKTGTKITSIQFTPKKILKNENPEFETKKKQIQISPSWLMSENIVNYLKNNYGFDTKEIKNNNSTLEKASKLFDLEQFLANKKRAGEGKRNPKGWIINAIKAEIETRK